MQWNKKHNSGYKSRGKSNRYKKKAWVKWKANYYRRKHKTW